MESTIFFGNGLNRLISSNISWDKLLDKIKGIDKFKDDSLPNTMIYERIILQRLLKEEDVLQDEFLVKKDIANLLKDIQGNELYKKMYHLNIQHYITTNYDYGFISSLGNISEILYPIQEFSTEDVYSIRRIKKIRNSKESKKHFWQIHGEIRKPATIMLGVDHYCGSIGKIDGYIKGNYKYVIDGEEVTEASIEKKFASNSFNNSSWIELFFTTNIHIIGFSLDFSETDLWWIITKRARMMKSLKLRRNIKNKIHFYCNKIDEQKKDLLECMKINVHIVELSIDGFNYMSHYQRILGMIHSTLT